MNEMTRRELMRRAGLLGVAAGATRLLSGCGGQAATPEGGATTTAGTSGTTTTASSGAPVKIGFIPLTDCASLVVAKEKGFFTQAGVEVDVQKQANWLAVRDKLSSGELDGAHCLFGMPFSVASGVSKASGAPMKIAMTINNNGQATTLSNKTFGGKVQYADFGSLRRALDSLPSESKRFAMTFPGGTHDMWLRLTLAATGIDPKSVQIKVIPPPQMVANMKAGNLDGYNVGEPWGGKAVADEVGFTFIATQDLWRDHPEKALVVNGDFAEKRRADLKKVMMGMIKASQFIDDPKNKDEVAEIIGTKAYVGAEPKVIAARLKGDYDLGGGLGKKSFAANKDYMVFSENGATNFPRYSHGIWFLTQYQRFGLPAKMNGTAESMAKEIIMQDLYREVATEMKLTVPTDDMKPFKITADKVSFDPTKPDAALKSYTAELNARRALWA